MPPVNPGNLTVDDPEDYTYVSAKNYGRKKAIQDGHGNELEKMIGRPGPITGIMLSIVDMFTTLFIKFTLLLMNISTMAFTWVNTLIFGNFVGLIPSSVKQGQVISLKWFRYFMTVVMPPFGVFLHKGIYGWFNIGICLVLTYINYVAGIVYAFVICMRNRYADQYEDIQIKKAMAANPENNKTGDYTAFWSTLVFLGVILLSLYFMIIFS